MDGNNEHEEPLHNDPDKEQRYKEYCKSESDEAYTTITKNQEEYDKQLLTLSTGLLAVIVAFLKDLVHLDVSVYRPLLYLSFASLGLTICCVLVSFQVSIAVLERVRVYWKEQLDGNTEYPFPIKLGTVIRYINWASGFFFITGVALTFLFITINLHYQTKPQEKNVIISKVQEGLNVKVQSMARS